MNFLRSSRPKVFCRKVAFKNLSKFSGKHTEGLQLSTQPPFYLFNVIPRKNASHPTLRSDSILLLGTKLKFFQNSYFPAAIKEWNRLDIDIRKSDSISIFKNVRPLPNKISNSHNPQGLNFLTRLRLGLSHLRYYKFKHNFLDSINSLCSCGSNIETTLHFLLYCPNFIECRNTLMSEISEFKSELITLIETLIFGDNSFSQYNDSRILDATTALIVTSKRFDDPRIV